MADKVIYMRPGETLEIRHIMHEEYEKTARDWWSHINPCKDLIRIDGPGEITPALPSFSVNDWKSWLGAPQPRESGS